jgi:hypothetical protein
MGTGLYSVKNETVRFVTVSELSAEMRSAVGAFFRRSGLSNGFYELIDPLTQQTKFVLAAAVTDRPWPPRGVGAIEIQALVVAVIGDGDRAFLTPVIAGPENTTNVGLSAAVMKELLRGLQELKIEKVVFLAHEGSHLVAHILKLRSLLSDIGYCFTESRPFRAQNRGSSLSCDRTIAAFPTRALSSWAFRRSHKLLARTELLGRTPAWTI